MKLETVIEVFLTMLFFTTIVPLTLNVLLIHAGVDLEYYILVTISLNMYMLYTAFK